VEAGVIEPLKNLAHCVFEMDEVNPVFRVFQRAGLVVSVAESGPTGVELVEFDDPLPEGKGDLLAVALFDAVNALLQPMYRVLNVADDLQVQLQGVAIGE
jgi:hypothetical protein